MELIFKNTSRSKASKRSPSQKASMINYFILKQGMKWKTYQRHLSHMHIRKKFNNSLPPRGKYATIKFYRHIRERIFLRDRKLSRVNFMICYWGVIKENEGDIFIYLQRWKCKRRMREKVLRLLSLSCKSVMQINKLLYLVGLSLWEKFCIAVYWRNRPE